jgi:hypothetical protein
MTYGAAVVVLTKGNNSRKKRNVQEMIQKKREIPAAEERVPPDRQSRCISGAPGEIAEVLFA